MNKQKSWAISGNLCPFLGAVCPTKTPSTIPPPKKPGPITPSMDSRAKEDDIKFLEDDQMKEDDPSSPGTRKDVAKNLYITRESKETPGAGLSRTCSTPPSMTPVPEVEKI